MFQDVAPKDYFWQRHERPPHLSPQRRQDSSNTGRVAVARSRPHALRLGRASTPRCHALRHVPRPRVTWVPRLGCSGCLSSRRHPKHPVPTEDTMTTDTLQQLTTNALATLADALDRGYSDALTTTLRAMSRFHRYSFG